MKSAFREVIERDLSEEKEDMDMKVTGSGRWSKEAGPFSGSFVDWSVRELPTHINMSTERYAVPGGPLYGKDKVARTLRIPIPESGAKKKESKGTKRGKGTKQRFVAIDVIERGNRVHQDQFRATRVLREVQKLLRAGTPPKVVLSVSEFLMAEENRTFVMSYAMPDPVSNRDSEEAPSATS